MPPTPGADFEPTGEGHLRMSFCVPEETTDLALDRIELVLKKM